ncbi:hypothetical protein Bca101_024181 [Brassica carinata]
MSGLNRSSSSSKNIGKCLPSKELLDDLCSRFVLNVPEEDQQSFERILFLVEYAYCSKRRRLMIQKLLGVEEDCDVLNDGLPTQRVIKKARKANQKCEDIGLDKIKVSDKKVLKTKIQVPHLLDNASGDETLSDPVQRDKARDLGDRLDAIVALARKMNKPTSPTPSSPQTKLASSQLFPFVGNSTVKHIITQV